jgi:hypothetical protein
MKLRSLMRMLQPGTGAAGLEHKWRDFRSQAGLARTLQMSVYAGIVTAEIGGIDVPAF